jgi:predicted nucleic acid-binding protein
MARKATIYVGTSTPNALFHPPEERREATRRFFNEVVPTYDAFISELCLAEIRATPEMELRDELLATVQGYEVLPVAVEAEELAREYLKYLDIPEADALHIAIASVEGVNYLVTWNMRHLAKEKTRRMVDNLNFLMRRPAIFIVTPQDLLD